MTRPRSKHTIHSPCRRTLVLLLSKIRLNVTRNSVDYSSSIKIDGRTRTFESRWGSVALWQAGCARCLRRAVQHRLIVSLQKRSDSHKRATFFLSPKSCAVHVVDRADKTDSSRGPLLFFFRLSISSSQIHLSFLSHRESRWATIDFLTQVSLEITTLHQKNKHPSFALRARHGNSEAYLVKKLSHRLAGLVTAGSPTFRPCEQHFAVGKSVASDDGISCRRCSLCWCGEGPCQCWTLDFARS